MTQRPRVVLPQPDSPTRPKVSPCSTLKLTPSTALTVCFLREKKPLLTEKCFFKPLTSKRGGVTCLGISVAPSFREGVGRVARAVTDEVEGQNHGDDAEGGAYPHPRVKLHDEIFLRFLQEHAPTHHGRFQADA